MVERNVLVHGLSQPLCALERIVPRSKVPYRGRAEITTPASGSLIHSQTPHTRDPPTTRGGDSRISDLHHKPIEVNILEKAVLALQRDLLQNVRLDALVEHATPLRAVQDPLRLRVHHAAQVLDVRHVHHSFQ